MLRCGNHALYACCVTLRNRKLHEQLGTLDNPMQTIDELFSLPEQDALGGKVLRFLGFLGSEDTQPVDEVKN